MPKLQELRTPSGRLIGQYDEKRGIIVVEKSGKRETVQIPQFKQTEKPK